MKKYGNTFWKIVYASLLGLPIMGGLYYAILYSLGLLGILATGFTLSHWHRFFSESNIFYYFIHTILSALVSVTIAIIGALYVSYVVFINKIHRKRMILPILLPLVSSPLIAAFSWYILLGPSGIISRILYHFHIISSIHQFPRMINDLYGIGIMITHIYLIMPVFILVHLLIDQKSSMRDMYDASALMGSSDAYFFNKVYCSIQLRTNKTVYILYTIFVIGMFEVPMVVGVSHPKSISVYIWEKFSKYNLHDIPLAFCATIVYLCILSVFIHYLYRKKNKDSLDI